MIQRRLLSFIFVLLLAFAQQQAMVHSYSHLSGAQQSSTSEKHGQTHSELCGQCIVLAGIGAAVGSQAHAIHSAPVAPEHTAFIASVFFSSTYRNYQSRAPPHSTLA